MKINFTIIILLFAIIGSAQSNEFSLKKSNKAYRAEQNEKFKNKETSPLEYDAIPGFKKLKFFKASKKYLVQAKFVRTPDTDPFEMPTTTDRKPMYQKYGEAQFELDGQSVKLSLYRNLEYVRHPIYKNKLFLPFKDATCGNSTYGGGRFIYTSLPDGDMIEIDFNQAFNPYCAYSDRYSCPIVPRENYLKIPIKAGVKAYKKH